MKVSLLESLLKLSVAALSTADDDDAPRREFCCSSLLPALRALLKFHVYLEHTQGNRKKVFSCACQQLLCLAMQLRSLLEKLEGNLEEEEKQRVLGDICEDLTAFYKSLFNKFVLEHFL